MDGLKPFRVPGIYSYGLIYGIDPSASTGDRPRNRTPPPHHRRSFQKTLDSAKRTMVLSEIVMLALDSFRASKVRFALTALGMVIGSASLILVVTIGLTGKQYVLKAIQGVGTNMVELEYAGGGVGAITDTRNDFLTRDDELAVMRAGTRHRRLLADARDARTHQLSRRRS